MLTQSATRLENADCDSHLDNPTDDKSDNVEVLSDISSRVSSHVDAGNTPQIGGDDARRLLTSSPTMGTVSSLTSRSHSHTLR